ncbi:cardiac-enriched FHL2-interacting protein [Leuresthes tenuis]|uniref:cardiac-enriched FHL2-interacting protein n=1 Tax=Leuresthes tenuis TaxID=355514 RepID=UPI003B5077ED
MTSVEKRRSSRKSSGHRKHSDGGFSDTSSGGSFLDENDREVSSLTDRAFRSLCIGDEAVYNDSDLNGPSPSAQRDRQLAFSQSGQDIDIESREREELKRAAHENFNLRMQQYGQDWIHRGVYASENHRDPQWEVYGERTQGRVSATFQHSYVETSQQGKSMREEELSFLSNGASEFSSQQPRSRSRVSSLIRAFNSDGHRDGAGMDDKLREWNDETSWDKSALMSIQRELSEFSTSYQQNFDTSHFPPFSFRDTNYCSSEVAAMTHMSHNSASSYMRSSHTQRSMSAQVNCNSNFFIHSEFSPFKVWRDHNRFPFQQGEVSGFMDRSEFPKWYETPMYKELSLETQPQSHCRRIRHPRNNLAPMAPPTPPCSTLTSSVLQKASAVEKRCESELVGHYPHRKRTQSLGNRKLLSQRPSTASPTIEMSRRVKDTISSVKALQQKIKMMTGQNITTGEIANQQGISFRDDNLFHPGNNAVAVEPNVVHTNTSTTPFKISQQLTPVVYTHQEAETSAFQQYEVSPQPVEHPPVRAESRGATPDIRMSSYKSRATSLLFNLKDNRKRVKSTYSPTKFKGLDTMEKNNKPFMQEPRETVVDIPIFPDPAIQFMELDESSRTNAAVNPYHSPGLSLTTQRSQSTRANTGQYPENISSDYQTGQMQGQMVPHPGFSGFIPENYTSNQLVNGQNPHEYLASFTPYKQGMIENVGTLGGFKQSMDSARLNADNNQSGANTEQAFNETVGRVFTKVDRYEQFKHNKHDYNNMSPQNNWRQTNSVDTEKLSLKETISPSRQETAALKDRSRQEDLPIRKIQPEKVECRETFGFGIPPHEKADLVKTNINNQLQGQREQKKNEIKNDHLTQSSDRYNDREYRNQLYPTTDKPITTEKIGQMKQYKPVLREREKESEQQTKVKPQFENYQKNSPSNPESVPAPTMTKQMRARQNIEVRGEEVIAEHIKAQHAQAELAKVQQRAQVEQPKAESAGLILTEQTGTEEVKTEVSKSEPTKPESVRLAKEEVNIGERMKRKRIDQSRENQPEQAREEEIKAEQTRAQKLTNEPTNITEKENIKHMGEEQDKQVKAEQAETEKLNDAHIKTELAKNEQAGPARIKQVKTEQVSIEQVKRGQVEAEQIKAEKDIAEQATAESKKAEETEQTEKPQIKTKYMKTKDVVREVKTDTIKGEDVLQCKDEEVGHVNADKPTAKICVITDTKLEERRILQAKLEETKVERTKAELSKTENLLERSAKLTAKLAATQQVRSEPDKVEQVKTELAKAKAELAKIKEKMRGEQKEKARNKPNIKESNTSNSNTPLRINMDTNKDYKKLDQAEHMQTDREADDYDRLREKYGLTNAMPTNRNEVSATESDANETKVLPLDKVGTGNNEKSNDGHSLTNTSMTPNKENKEEVNSFKNSEVTESKHAYNQSSKGFKLSSTNSFPRNLGANEDNAVDKLKESHAENVEKCNSVKETDSQQRDSDLAKLRPIERKSKSTGHAVGPDKDLNFIPLKALSHKERAQTKQEILTSKIKAHAEKEISAIKEKGFAIREGFIGKSSTKQLAGNIRQKPPSQEVSKKHESTVSNDISAKHSMEPSGVQTEPAIIVSPPSSATIPVKSAATTTQLADHLETSREANQTAIGNMNKAEGLPQMELGMKSPAQNKEQIPMINKEKLENSEKLQEEPQDNQALDSDINKTMDDPTQASWVESEDTTPEDYAPLNVVIGQKDTPVADDSLQIMGIMVSVRERETSVNIQENNKIEKEINEIEKECSKSELVEWHPISGSDENTPSNEGNSVKAREIEKTNSTVKADHTENLDETSSLEARKSSMTGNVQEKRTSLQKESSTVNAKPQRETQPGPVAEKDVPLTVTVPAEDKALAETKAVYNKNTVTEQTKEKTNEKANNAPSSNNSEKKDKNIQDDDVHIDCIAIRVVPVVSEKDDVNMVGKHPITTFPSNVQLPHEHKQAASSCCEEKANTLNSEHCSKDLTFASYEQKTKDSVEDKLAVQYVLSSVKKLSDSLKSSSKQICNNTTKSEAENQKSESNVQPVEGNYFQVQAVTEISRETDNSTRTAGVTSKERELLGLLPKKTAMNNELCEEGKSDVFVFSVGQGDRKEDESNSVSIQDEKIESKNLETENTLTSKNAELSLKKWSNNGTKEEGQANHIKKNYTDNLSTDKQSSHSAMTNTVAQRSGGKPKPKERVSAIPEISAIADYARLKVIVSEEKEVNTVQEFPPNKKEGFFPLIQTRHNRRPVFTADPQDLSVKDKKMPNKTEMSAKVSKEPKALVFPIMEKEHQRTGMFKLGDKDKQERTKSGGRLDNEAKYINQKETDKSPTPQTQQMAGADTQSRDQSSGQQNNHPLQESTSSNVTDMSKGLTYLEKNSPPNSTLGQIQNRKENTTHPSKDERTDMQQDKYTGAKTEYGRADQLNQERLTNQHEETNTKQHYTRKQLEEDQASGSEKEKKEEHVRRKHLIQESRASLVEEEKRATQREEERRAKEREATAIMIKERRENQRQTEKRAEEERKVQLTEEARAAQKSKEIQAKQREERITVTENEEKGIMIHEYKVIKLSEEEEQKTRNEEMMWMKSQEGRVAVVEQQRSAPHEKQESRAAQQEQQRRVAEEVQRRTAQEEQQRRAAEEQQRKAEQEEQQRRAAEEQQRKAEQEKQQRRAAEEQQRKAEQEKQQRRAAEEQQRKAEQEKQQRRAAEEQQRKAEQEKQQRRAAEEQQRKAEQEKQQRRAAEEQQRKAEQEKQQRRAAEEQQRKAEQEKQQRRAAEEQQRKAEQEEQQRRAAEEQQRKAEQEKQQRRAAEEQQRKAEQEEKQRRAAEEQQRKAEQEKQQRRAAEEQQRKAEQEKQQRRAAEEQQRKAEQEKQQRRAAEEQQRKAEQEKQQRRAAEEQQRKAEQEKQQRRAAEEQQRKAEQEKQQRRAAEEQQRKAEQEKQQRRAAEEQQRKAEQEEQQRRAAEEQQRKAEQEKQQRRAAEEQQRKAEQEKQQRRAAEEQQRKAEQEEQQRRAAEEQQRKAEQEKQQRRAAEEQQRKAEQEKQQRRAAEEQQRKAEQEKQQRRAAEEQQRKAEQEEQQRRAAEEQQRKAEQAAEEQQRKAEQEKQQRRAAEEQQRKAEQEKQQRRAAEEQQRKVEQEKQQMRAAEEQQRKAEQEKQQRRAAEEQQRKAEQEEQQKRVLQEQQKRSVVTTEEQRHANQIKEKILADIVEEKKRTHREEEEITHIDEQVKAQQQSKEPRKTYSQYIKEEWTKAHREEKEDENRAAEKEKIMREIEEKQARHESTRLTEDKRVTQELMQTNRENEIQAKMKEDEKKKSAQREKARATQIEMQKRAAQKMDTLQYYAITSTDTERKPKERHQSSPLPSPQRNIPVGLESTDDSSYHIRPYRPHAPASPAPSLPRSNTSSPALGAKPSMFRVKDNTLRGSPFTKSVKPRFHKNYGEDLWMASPSDRLSYRGDNEQETKRRSAGTPVYPDVGSNRFATVNESSTSLSTSSSQDYSTYTSYHRPHSRRSIVMDDDESRSVISYMSEDVESFATSAADLADVRSLFDFERPESACSFSSDVSRSMGKPPAVPPKSEKALRRAQRLTSRRIKKELSTAAADSPAGAEKEASSFPSSSFTEVCSSNRHAVASPHFSPPVSLAHAPTLGSSLPSSHTEQQSSHRSFHASPHATGPISLPIPAPHASSAVSLPVVSPHASGLASQPAAPKTVAHVPSSPTLHHANHPTPVTQYHVESTHYPQSFPLTQRKVLQDLGSGQYFVVDVPVQVKTKTFFDPETGKYVQLNVRESGQSISRPQSQQTSTQPQLQPQMLIKSQIQSPSQPSTVGKPFMLYEGYPNYSQSYQPATVNSVHPNRSSVTATLQQDQKLPRESRSYTNSAIEVTPNSEGNCYSPEKTPYMDTVNNINKIFSPVHSTQESYESFSDCNANTQLAGSSVCENEPRDIITMSELEDFMELSDW